MLGRIATDKFLKTLDHIESGRLTVTTPDGRVRAFEGAKPGPEAAVTLHDWSVPAHLAWKGDVAMAEDYRNGLWEADDLENLIAFGIHNRGALDRYVFGTRTGRMREAISYLARINSRRGSRKNIHAHYDLGNDFYALWLDPSMTYSSALYATGNEALETAQNAKYDRMLAQTGITSGSVLEIGCGWGGFAERASASGDYAVKGVTLSEEQHRYASRRLEGHQNVSIALEDYRQQEGRYDSIVSIEMFEAVGERYWTIYFDRLAALLADKGRAVIQTITMNDADFKAYRNGSDFIRSHIFPGGMLPSPSIFREKAAQSGLAVVDSLSFGVDYARTLKEWLSRFDARADAVRGLGYDDGFIRLWRFYLAACAAGFRTGRTDVMQLTLQRM